MDPQAAIKPSEFHQTSLPKSEMRVSAGALIVPIRRRIAGPGGRWAGGVFSADGSPLPTHMARIQKPFKSVDPTLTDPTADLQSAPVIPGDWLYCGASSKQFGHIMTRGLGQLWARQFLPTGTGLAFAGIYQSSSQNPVIDAVCEALDLTSPHHVATRPTRFERLHLAPDLFSDATNGTPAPAYVDWIRQKIPQADGTGRRIYVSRSALVPTLGRILCEDILEQNLIADGYEVFHPQAASLKQQLAIYRAATDIIAMESSALHVIPFASQPGARLTVIQRRPDLPALIKNQITGFSKGSATFVNAISRIYWPEVRADNSSLAALDFDALKTSLFEAGALNRNDQWRSPSEEETQESLRMGRARTARFMNDAERRQFLRDRRRKRRKSDIAMTQTDSMDPIPHISGKRYFRMLKSLHERIRPDWYLEVGTFSGRSLALANCNFVSVDPSFQIKHPVINATGKEMLFVQKPSDDFFASTFIGRNKIKFDMAFLDGMHQFEFLLRDFINTEKVMQPGGCVLLHDCCPTTHEMAVRDFHPGDWTGDVWKTLLILLRNRPDLDIQVANAARPALW